MSEEADLIYCYPGSTVLINKLNLRTEQELKKAERLYSAVRIAQLIRRPVPGNFDLQHLQAIHAFIFQDIYSWAGKLRRVEIAKGLFFCRAQYIRPQAEKLFLQLQHEKYLREVPDDKLPLRAAYYLSEINAIHPFRDGNGRAQREFIRALLLPRAIVSYAKVNPAAMTEASIASFGGDYSLMEKLLTTCITFRNPQIHVHL